MSFTKCYHFRLLLVTLLFYLQFENSLGQNCESKQRCGQCIQELGCFWCSQPVNGSYCLHITSLSLCTNDKTENPQSSFRIINDQELSESQQIKPQRIKLTLRKNQKHEIKFVYKQSENYPVDLYYIMDFSNSMVQSKLKVATLGKDLAKEMMKKTNNFKLGFGSFVDKLTLPYVNINPASLKNPCSRSKCEAPYTFKNHLSLNANASIFEQVVNEAKLSGNMDTPEAGFDALMQAMVCTDIIGWRPNARHLLVMSTDAQSHIAGDGKLGGIVEPNDGKCHMENNLYTEGLTYDYPSVSHLNYVARKNNINIIFAIVIKKNTELSNHYKGFSNVIDNSKTGELNENSNNVVQFISEIYEQIRDSVRITSNASKDIDVNITSTCAGFLDGSCNSVKPGQILQFSVSIEPKECDPNAPGKKFIEIKPEGLTDSMIIELDVHCDCQCSQQKDVSSNRCETQGDYECGMCVCHEGWYGDNCKCDKAADANDDATSCIKPNGKNEICSGQGKCICGNCKCKTRPNENEHITGKYCECDDFSCPLKCSERGSCQCGKCVCERGWSGPGCECSTDTSQCIEPGSNEICSGHGDCICGQCQCKENTEGTRHSGVYCEECTSCPAQRCDEFKPCVERTVYQTGIYANSTELEFETKCKGLNIEIFDSLEEIQEGEKTCRVLVDGDCTINFQYTYQADNTLILKAERKKSCPEPPNILGWIIGIIAATILIGIITLVIWKIITTIHDKNEYVKFEKERAKLKWNRQENPLYVPGTTSYNNPQYKRASQRASMRFVKSPEQISQSK